MQGRLVRLLIMTILLRPKRRWFAPEIRHQWQRARLRAVMLSSAQHFSKGPSDHTFSRTRHLTLLDCLWRLKKIPKAALRANHPPSVAQQIFQKLVLHAVEPSSAVRQNLKGGALRWESSFGGTKIFYKAVSAAQQNFQKEAKVAQTPTAQQIFQKAWLSKKKIQKAASVVRFLGWIWCNRRPPFSNGIVFHLYAFKSIDKSDLPEQVFDQNDIPEDPEEFSRRSFRWWAMRK